MNRRTSQSKLQHLRAEVIDPSSSRLAGDERGAVLLLSLAGIIITLMFALMIYDVGLATKDKTEVQGASDFAALTQSSVKARSMNMIAYGNIAKRSIWAVHSLYPAHIHAYRDWIFDYLPQYCEWDPDEQDVSDDDVFYSDAWRVPEEAGDDGDPLMCGELEDLLFEFELETGEYEIADEDYEGDFRTFSGRDVSRADDSAVDDSSSSLEPIVPASDGSSEYFYYDLKALDNHQRYIAAATPWWAWTEQLMTGIRNGATVSASVPPPPDMPSASGAYAGLYEHVNPGDVGTAPNEADQLPVSPPRNISQGRMRDHIEDRLAGFDGSNIDNLLDSTTQSIGDPFVAEHVVNNLMMGSYTDYANQNSTELFYQCVLGDGCNTHLAELGTGAFNDFRSQASDSSFRNEGLNYSEQAFADAGDPAAAEPWSIQSAASMQDWTERSTNIVFTYMHDELERRGGGSQDKFDFFGAEDDISQVHGGLISSERRIHEAMGYWGMARSELTFADTTVDQPDLWHPAWTARLRPVTLPEDSDIDMGPMFTDVFHTVEAIGSMGMDMTEFHSMAGSGAGDSYDFSRDFARLQWMLRSMDTDTSEGLGR